jgi:protein-tyrosine phosphatase
MHALADPRRLRWDACLNVRDLGGFPARDGRPTRWRAIVRSDNLCRLTHLGRQALMRYGIRTVVDLRSPDELPLETDPFSRGDLDGIAYLNIPLLSREFLARHSTGLDRPFEIAVVDICGQSIAALFSTIAVAPAGGVLVYCHAGKERTGIASALLLAVIGVPNETITAEYALSDRYLEPLYAAWIAAQPESDRERVSRELVTNPARMTTLLAHLDSAYGGIAEYLRSTGLEERDLERVRERILT